jgi:hypothetical protein
MAQNPRIRHHPAARPAGSRRKRIIEYIINEPNLTPPTEGKPMPTDLQLSPQAIPASEILNELAALTRDHLLHFRLEVGRVILQHFFGGSSAAYSDKDHTKEAKFADFLSDNAADLALLGLKEHTLRQCVALRTVYRSLPTAAQDRLGYSRTLALVAMADPSTRAQLALAAVDRQWTVAELKQGIDAATAGLWYDTDPQTPGVQALPIELPAARPQAPGRLVARAEKWAAEFEAFANGWAGVPAGKASKLQQARLKRALTVAVARLQAMAAQLED